MQSYQERVIVERAELNEKIERLAGFFDTQTYYFLSVAEQDRLAQQLGIMNSYRDILDRRIEAFRL